ncbi:MAG: tetraacyldisaccharide 4'-kinase [Acidobacteria bacterium]|nr:tetraacyldisaccharide 4'-kinase [Acidobacteriota bacterium]
MRERLFDKGVYRSHSLGAPTISVGNITVGGTGKTPFVAFVAEFLASRGERVCIISRGYKRENERSCVIVSDGDSILADARNAGDEPLELAIQLRGKASVIVDADRIRAAARALDALAPTVFVLDDAFQHFRAKRDLDIVLIDATNPFGNRKTLPFGILREPLSGLERAGMIVVSRANLVSNERLERIVDEIRSLSHCPIFVSRNEFSGFRALNRESAERDPAASYFAFCAIGNPENFFDQMRAEGFKIVGTKAFPDHHYYSAGDIASITSQARSAGADVVVTTAKDSVKLVGLEFPIPCVVAENRLSFDDEERFGEILLGVTRERVTLA